MFDKSKLASILEDEGLVKTAAYPGDVEIPREFLEKMFNANKSKVMDALKKSKTPESPDIDLRNLSFGKPTLGHAIRWILVSLGILTLSKYRFMASECLSKFP